MAAELDKLALYYKEEMSKGSLYSALAEEERANGTQESFQNLLFSRRRIHASPYRRRSQNSIMQWIFSK